MNRDIRPGVYRHFKGNLYQVYEIAIHSETDEEYVVYRALYGDRKLFIRPAELFFSEIDKQKYPEATQRFRFERIEENEEVL